MLHPKEARILLSAALAIEPRQAASMLKTTSRLARVAPRAGLVRLARRQQSGLAGWASELYSSDPKFWTYTAATCGLVVTMYTLDSMSNGSKPAPHHHVEHHYTPGAAPADEEPEPT